MIAAAAVDSDRIKYAGGTPSGEIITPIRSRQTEPRRLSEQIRDLVEELQGSGPEEVDEVVVVSTGRVDRSEKKLAHFDTLDHGERTNVEMPDLEVPLSLENDCNAAALGEYRFGRASDYRCSVHLTVDVGIGAGIIYDGEIFRGGGHAGEVGYLPIKLEEDHHSYGVEGAWEAFASTRGLQEYLDKFTDLSIEKPTYRSLKKLAEDSPEAAEVVDMVEETNAAGISSVINTFDPGYVSIGGRMALESEKLIDRIRSRIEGSSFVEFPDMDFVQTEERVKIYGALAASEAATDE